MTNEIQEGSSEAVSGAVLATASDAVAEATTEATTEAVAEATTDATTEAASKSKNIDRTLDSQKTQQSKESLLPAKDSKHLGNPKHATRNPKLAIIVAACAAFLATFNETYLNVAFTPIMADLGVDVSLVQWLATAYMLGAAVMVPVSAFAYRSLPTKPLFCSVVGLFIIGSVVGALAPNFSTLLTGRIIQALGTGLLIPIGMSITLDSAPRNKLGVYMGVMGAMTTLGPSSSVVVAGILLSFAGWQLLLWVFAALSVVCLLLGICLLGNVAKLTHPRLDFFSVVLVGLALVGILYGISTVFTGNIIIAASMFVIGFILLLVFMRRQGRLQQPLIDLTPLRVMPYRLGVIINMLSLVTMFAMNIIIPMFMQSVLGVPALVASLTLFPAIALCCVVSPLAGRIFDKHGAKLLLPLGFALVALFAVALSIFISTASVVVLAILYIPVICGSALVIGPVQSLALSHLAHEQNPHGVTILSTGFQIAGCIGASLFTGVYAGVSAAAASVAGGGGAGADVSGSVSGAAASAVAEATSAAADAAASAAATTMQAATTGFLVAGILVAVFAIAGLIISLVINRYKAATHLHQWESDSSDIKERHDASMASSFSATESLVAANVKFTDLQSHLQSQRIPLANIMKRDVFTLKPEASILDALELFTNKGISGAPVVDDNISVIGFVSDGDIMRYLADQLPMFKNAWSFVVELENENFDQALEGLMKLTVADVAVKHVISVDAHAEIGSVCKVLVDHHLRKAPVLDQGKLVGIINRSNIIHYSIQHYLSSKI
ncbi:MAG: MFS transporter [Coriobacteriales bacterium]|jgi:DHA2 family lincomycin resistance protein-like MFS transporter|nr:MFS transporter [Coriobacteriales bacterium]